MMPLMAHDLLFSIETLGAGVCGDALVVIGGLSTTTAGSLVERVLAPKHLSATPPWELPLVKQIIEGLVLARRSGLPRWAPWASFVFLAAMVVLAACSREPVAPPGIHFPTYEAASAQVMATIRAHPGAVVEVLGWDEAFVGVETDDPVATAATLKERVRTEVYGVVEEGLVLRLDPHLGAGRWTLQGRVEDLPPQAADGPLPDTVAAYRGDARAMRATVDVPVIAVGRVLPEVAEEMLRTLLDEYEEFHTEFWFTRSSSPRAVDPEELAELAVDLGFPEDVVHAVPQLDDAMTEAVQDAAARPEFDGAVLVTGSITVVGEARTLLGL